MFPIHLRSPASLPMSDACAKNVSVFLSRRKRTRLGHIGATPFANASINPSRRRLTKHGTEKGGWLCTVAPHTHTHRQTSAIVSPPQAKPAPPFIAPMTHATTFPVRGRGQLSGRRRHTPLGGHSNIKKSYRVKPFIIAFLLTLPVHGVRTAAQPVAFMVPGGKGWSRR